MPNTHSAFKPSPQKSYRFYYAQKVVSDSNSKSFKPQKAVSNRQKYSQNISLLTPLHCESAAAQEQQEKLHHQCTAGQQREPGLFQPLREELRYKTSSFFFFAPHVIPKNGFDTVT